MSHILIRNCEVRGRTGVDVLIRGSHIADIGRALPSGRAEVVEAGGGALLPGLTDHHLHLHALAADATSVRCGPPHVHDGAELARALAGAPDVGGWVRGVGYIETVAGELDSAALDRLHAARPVRIQHRSGAMWVLNGAAASAAGLATGDHPGIERDSDGLPTGRVWRADEWLRGHLPRTAPPALRDIGRTLARFGITAVTDASPDLPAPSIRAIIGEMESGDLPQRVHLLGAPLDPPDAREGTTRLTVGPYKIVLADSGLPDITELGEVIRHAHHTGRPVAAHCVTREALLIFLVALDDVGVLDGDRIEHGALIPEESIEGLHRRGLRVVTQPGFLADRGDHYLDHVEERDLPDLYRCRTLLDAGVPLALSSDAPYGPLDPWTVMSAAVHRRARSGAVVGAAERLTGSEALSGYLASTDDPGGPPRRVEVGAVADLVLLRAPLLDTLGMPSSEHVITTLIGGDPIYSITT
ncbi:MAG: amidohydrolase family protein [Rhodococcus sp. (in: high G+C Gram-positive bacteria)]|uniref:amidohydrolase family protein n=1 Tax=Rhodococcus sp. TaxID=1831 RepID=UPI003BAFFC41